VKQGNVRKSWKRRFFALDDFTICYFKCEQVGGSFGALLRGQEAKRRIDAHKRVCVSRDWVPQSLSPSIPGVPLCNDTQVALMTQAMTVQ
jgi:hypothetical protein